MKKIAFFLISFICLYCTGQDNNILKTIKTGNSKALATMLAKENTVNNLFSGYTPLTYAVKIGANEELLDILIRNGADVNLTNKGQKTPLMYAAKYKRNNLILYLIKKGADVNFQNKRNITALLYTVKYDNPEGFNKLLKLGANTNAKINGSYTVLDYIKKENLQKFLEILGLPYELQLTTDGPYVFTHKDNYEVLSTFSGDKTAIRKSNIAKENAKIDVIVDNESNDTFSVALSTNFETPPTIYKEPKKLLVVSDIEGNFYALKKILEGTGVMNKDYQWTFGQGHLVLVGDFFDRGKNVTPVLWLIYELERQAEEANGMVHFIIGNHEVMNIQGDYRYVQQKYKNTALGLHKNLKDLYSENTILGNWLTSKNCVEKIGDAIYVHGGLSKRLAEDNFTLEEMNTLARKYYRKPISEIKENKRARGVFSGNVGPLWYRGYFTEKLPQAEIDFITDHYKANTIIVGHTPVKNIKKMYHNKIIAIDLKHPSKEKQGTVKALWKEGNTYYQIDENGEKVKL
ncbi:ankyrin repeat domain-containing protein [Tenacibaculum amylolyticum]|uniref:ankyrin repeat domain-containing protein n=1 Tax=Tenacibaculum amylolyticum TaxID=104269 RepID=UPI003894FE0B